MHDYIDLQIRETRPAAAAEPTSICHLESAILSLARQTALERQELSRTYLAHHDLKANVLL